HFSSHEIDVIEQCLQGKLPALSSYLITQKIGFIKGLGGHDAKGKAEVLRIDKNSYFRLDSFEIGYEPKLGENYQIPELHVYLTQDDVLSPEIYLDKLKTKLGSKNYRLPDVDLNTYDTVLIINEITQEPFAKITLKDPFYVNDVINNIANDFKTVPSPKIESKIIYERYGFFEGIDNYNAKGIAAVDYEEDEGELKIENFEISQGDDLRVYLAKNEDVAKSGYWTFDSNGNLYVSSGNTDQILRYTSDGTFQDIFVKAKSGGLDGPKDLTFGPDGNLYVSSGNTDQILRYTSDGTFQDIFVNSNKLKTPTGITFGPDGNLYVISSKTNEIIQNIISNGELLKTKKFVTDDSLALYQPKQLKIFDGKICVNSYLTDDIHCYEEETGKSLGKLRVSFDRSLISRENSVAGPDGELYVSDDLRNEILRYDGITGLFSNIVVKTERDQLSGPSYLAFGPDGNLYVSSDDKILRFDGDHGTFIDVFISQNKAGLSNSQQLSFDKNFLYVSSYDNNRILRYDSNDGDFVDEFIPSRDHGLQDPVGNVLDKKRGIFYVTSTNTNKILQYDAETGQFLNEIKLPSIPHGLELGGHALYISMFDTNEVLSYNLNSKQFASLLTAKDGLDGPEGLVFDAKNNTLYVSSSMNSKIIGYDLEKNVGYEIIVAEGNGILQTPQGLSLKDNALFISNHNNNEILRYNLENKILDVFIHDTGDLIRPGGIAFGPYSDIYVINKNNNGVYRYDIQTGNLLSKFAESPFTIQDSNTIGLRSIIFTKDGNYLFASNPGNNEILAYDIKTGKYLDDFFEKNHSLNYPTNLTLTPDGKYVLIINYGDNTISRFTISGEFDKLFLNPGSDGLTELRDIRFGQDGNLYVMGGVYGDIFRYDGITGDFLGVYDNNGYYIGKMTENTLDHNYLLNEIDTRKYDTAIIYDHFLERPYAKINLNDKKDIITPLDIGWNSFVSNFNVVQEPKLKSQEIMKKTGFFIGLDDITAFGQVITKSIGSTSLITLENFSLDYDENQYVSTKSKNMFMAGPNLIACIVSSMLEPICDNSNNSIYLGEFHSNAGDNRYLLKDIDLNIHDTIVIYDKTTQSSFATIPLRDYGVLRVSGESFLDWIQHDFAIIPLLAITLIIFPVFFDYTRSIFKILFFAVYFVISKARSSKNPNHFLPIILGKKISILIPAHNEESGIEESIKSALATDYSNKEIIVIDDGSKDNTWAIANSFAKKGLIKLIHRDPAQSSKAAALNHGMNYATGDYVLCMDGDTKLDKNALKNAAQYFDDENTVAFSGNVKILAGDGGVNNLLTKLQTYEYMIAIELGRRFTSLFKILLVISGAFGIFRKDLIKNLHTFDKDTLTEDFDLTLKFRKTRGRIRFIPDSIAYTYCPPTWSMWIRQRNRWAYGQFQTLSKNRDLLRKFTIKDSVSFIDMYVLDIVLSLLFPVGLVVLGIIAVILLVGDTLHVLVYPLTFVMSVFLILEFVTFLFATFYSGKLHYLKLSYLVPVMTFFYRPFLRMINLRAYLRAFSNKGSEW
ncbi:MAG: glycosyltransferase, partial [Nitrosopumilus sp.]|nr:glycosyltransferase [Nitrosopumilus sp.]